MPIGAQAVVSFSNLNFLQTKKNNSCWGYIIVPAIAKPWKAAALNACGKIISLWQ